jgi:hypothetical protein
MTAPRSIEAAFCEHVTPQQVLIRAGYEPMFDGRSTWWLQRLPDRRWNAVAKVNNKDRTVRIQSRGIPFPGRTQWVAANGCWFTFSHPMSAWAAFVALTARHDMDRAYRQALKIPAVREAIAPSLGELLHAA